MRISVSLQPSLLAMALLCFEAQEEHDPEHTDKIPDALKSLQQQLNVSTNRYQLLITIKYVLHWKNSKVICLVLSSFGVALFG